MLKVVVNKRTVLFLAWMALTFLGPSDEVLAQGFRRVRVLPSSGSRVSPHATSTGVRSRDSVAANRDRLIGVGSSLESPAIAASIEKALSTQAAIWDNAESRSPWGVMHNALAWGATGEILVDGQRKNSIVSLCENQRLKSVTLLAVVDGQIVALDGPGLQGHPGQFLAVLAQNGISTEQPIHCDDESFTVEDLIEYEKRSCRSDVELTFKLLALCHYGGTECEWSNSDGEDWNVERLLREELKQPINRVTCGGTHRLMAISLAVAKRKSEDLPLTGVWESAQTYVSDYHEYAFTLVNPDGSFSTEWFERRAAASDLQKRLQTTGHVLEWLVVTVSDDELTSERMKKMVYYVSQLLQLNIGEPWSVGPRAHALRALRLYQQRLQRIETNTPERIADLEASEEVSAVENQR